MVKTVKIPWAAWREPDFLELKFPDDWDVTKCSMNGFDKPILSDNQIKESIINPIGAKRISEIANGKSSVVIVVDDMTRTTPVSRIIPYVIEELKSANISEDKITILLAIGAHRPLNKEDCIKKLGKQIVDIYRIDNHHPYENLTELGESSLGTPIDVNTTYVNADLKIAISGVIPHLMAGFGGGAKIVLPGVSGIRTLEANHSAGTRGVGAGIGRMTGVRKDIEEIVSKVGLDFSINLLFNETGQITDITSGNFIDAHRKAMEIAKESYTTEVTRENNILFCNCFPEDSELNQALKGFSILFTAPGKLMDRKGAIVIMTSSYEGKGYHSLFAETGARSYFNFGDSLVWKYFVKRKPVLVYSPNINKMDLVHFFPENVKLFNDWEGLIKKLEEMYGTTPKATIIPTSIQLCEPPKLSE